MKRTSLFLVIVALATQLNAGWLKVYGERYPKIEIGYGVALSPDGGYVVVAGTGLIGHNTWLLKFDSEGDTLWTRSYAFLEVCMGLNGYCIKADQDGYIIAGWAWLPTDQNGEQLFLMRTDSQCDTLWTRFYGGEFNEKGYWVCGTSDGGYAATGYTGWSTELPRNLFLVRTDSEGDTLWTRTYGGLLDDFGMCVAETPDGGLIVTGYTRSFSEYEDYNVWLLKTDSEGDTLWTRTFGGENGDGGAQVIVTADGGYVIAGIYDLTGSMVPVSGDVLLIKTDSAGNLQWQKTYGMTGGGAVDQAYGVEQTSDGGYVVVGAKDGVGSTGPDVWLLKTDSEGDTLWTRTFGWSGTDDGRSVRQTPDGGYIVAGSTNSFSEERPDYDLLLIKTDSLGSLSIEESPVTPPVTYPDFEIGNPVIPAGGQVVLRYENYPDGFRASIYDAAGRKVDEIKSPNQAGVLIWGPHQSPGVYFIVPEGLKANPVKVVLIR